jgi:hypothetical protein
VRGIDPFGVLRHPAATLGVDDLDRFVRIVNERIREASRAASVAPPDHPEGGFVGALRALWGWHRRDVDLVERRVQHIELPALDRAGDVDDQPVEVGVGPTFHRRYRTVVRGGTVGAEEAMATIQSDPNVLADPRLAPFTKVRGEAGQMRVGDRYVVEITGPWKGAVEVVDVTLRSFRLVTLEGHMESGVIDMRTAAGEGDQTAFTIESWARSHDHFLHVMYDKLGIAKALQAEMWSIACDRFGELVHGERVGPLHVTSERAT